MTETSLLDASVRPGETVLDRDPAEADDARLCFIGRVRSAHVTRETCPKNLRAARDGGLPATLEIAAAFRPALDGLVVGQPIHLLTWLHGARRDLALQTPRHSAGASGTFALRSPVRPNPIGLHLVRITALAPAAGLVGIDAIDVLDNTPLLDIKPYFDSVDVPPPVNDLAQPKSKLAGPTSKLAAT
jgi:tRNA-Thr(GGU) m(6)t(6)A37 methyltransferase TsaA